MQTQYQLGKSCGGGIVKIGFIFYNTDPRNYEINYCIPKLVVPMKSKPSSTFEPALVRVNIKIKTNDNGKNKSKTAHYYNENGQNIYRYGRLKNYSKDSMVWNFTDAGKQLQLLTLGPDSRALSNGKDGTNCHIGITNFGINEKIQITGGGGGNKILGDGINSDDTFSKIPFFLGQDQKNIPNNLPGPESNPS